jgi:hypothetical protein
LEDRSDDDSDSYNNSSSDGDNSLEDFEDEDSESESGNMSSKSSKSTPGKKKRTPKMSKSPVPTVADVTDDLVKMKVLSSPSSKPFSMDYKFPFIITTYNEDGDEMVDIDLFVPFFPKDHFIPGVIDGNLLEIQTQIPQFFPDPKCVFEVQSR